MHITRRLAFSLLLSVISTPSLLAQSADQHATYDALLKRYVSSHPDGINRVDFVRWKANAQDRLELSRYVTDQSTRQPSKFSRADAFAYWVNLYNAIHLNVILDHYPVPSFSETPSREGPWKDKRITIDGRALSLDEMKSDVMRPTLSDPRVHYAVNCASFGCPRLMPRAWQAATLDADLDAAARAFINHTRAVKVLPSGDIQVSSIFIWYGADFGSDEAAVIAHIKTFADPDLAARLRSTSRLVDGGYDWSVISVDSQQKGG